MRRVLEEVEVKVVQTLSAGVDWILPLVPEGVVLCDGSGIHDAPVAEWVVLALLALLKDLSGFLEAQKEGRWAPRRLSDLEGKRVLLLGYGSIGKAVAERLRPFGVALFPVARHPRPGVYTREDLPALLPRADAVVLLLPLTPETRGIVDRDFLARMKEGALLVNAGRGGLVDTEALLGPWRRGGSGPSWTSPTPSPFPGTTPSGGLGGGHHPPRGRAFRGVFPPGGPLPRRAGGAVPPGRASSERGAGGVLRPPRALGPLAGKVLPWRRMRRIALPEDVAEALERFRRARGRGWRKALLHLAVEEERKALARLVWELRATAASHGLTEEEVARRLEG